MQDAHPAMQQPPEKAAGQPGDSARRHGEQPASSADAPDSVLEIVETWKPLSRPPIKFSIGMRIGGAVALAALAFLGYQVYEMLTYVPLAFENVAPVGDRGREGQGAPPAGRFDREVGAGDTSAAKVDRGVGPRAVPEPPPQDVPADVARTPVAPERVSPPVAVAPRAVPGPTSPAVPADAARTPGVPQRAGPPVAVARTAKDKKAPREEPCTAAVAAVGLCSPGSRPATEAETAAAAEAPIARPRPSVAGKAVERAAPRTVVPCTEGTTALGLCAAASTQGKE